MGDDWSAPQGCEEMQRHAARWPGKLQEATPLPEGLSSGAPQDSEGHALRKTNCP